MAISDGRRVVTTAGRRVQLSTASAAGGRVTIAAEPDNTGVVVVGGATVVAAAATRQGIPLHASPATGETRVSFYADDLSTVYIDAERDGDGVTYLVEG
jgi:hypothetical protein